MDPTRPPIPDLASILQTLKTYAPPRADNVPTASSSLEEGEYNPLDYDPNQAILSTTPNRPSPSNQPIPPPPPTITTTPSAAAIAATITTWPKALTHTITHIFSDPSKKAHIRHLITTQHAHERQWSAARKDLIRKTKGRDEARRELDSVLASVGGLVKSASYSQARSQGRGEGEGEGEGEGDEVTKELALFDRKVHRACREMAAASERELGELGVPFFCGGDKGNEKEEMLVLKGKMLQLLEDYCGDHQEEEE